MNDTHDTPELGAFSDSPETPEKLISSPPEGISSEDAAAARALALAEFAASSFADFPIDERIASAISGLGWEKPTEIQHLCLGQTLRRKDLAGFAQTGTGKTGVFLITVGNALLREPEGRGPGRPFCMVLVPTRELAVQIEQDARELLEPLGISSLAVYGGIDYEKQARKLREKIDIIVATPGRLKDYLQKRVVSLDDVQLFVCDEADRMFDMGFIDDVEFFLDKLPENAHKLLFSATTNDQVKELAFKYLESPEYVFANPESLTPDNIEQYALHCHAAEKLKVLLGLMTDHKPACAIIFTNTKLSAEWLHYKLVNNGIEADLITGDLPQQKRIRLIQRIKEGQVKALIATDVASRGLHIACVTHIYNFDLPDEAANYVHRVGRTARAGEKGVAYSLVCDDYGHNLEDINKMLGQELALQSQWYDEAYLKIEDKAGNPFAGATRRPSRNDSRGDSRGGGGRGRDQRPGRGRDQRPGRGRDSGGRGGGRKDASGRDEGRKPSGNRGRKPGRKPEGDSTQRVQASDSRGSRPQQQGGERAAKGNQRSRNDNRRRRGGQQRKEPVVAVQQSNHVPEPIPKSVGGIIKKLASTLFGRKK